MTSHITKTVRRWRTITHGYNWCWYVRATLRWMLVVCAVVDVCVFGIVFANLSNDSPFYMGIIGIFYPLAIAVRLLSLLVSTCAVTLLFLLRRNIVFGPVWILCGDVLACCALVVDLAITGLDLPRWQSRKGSSSDTLQEVPWGFSLALAALHVVAASIGIWETHTYRRMLRYRRSNPTKMAELEDEFQASGPLLSDVEMQRNRQLTRESTMSNPAQLGIDRVEMPNTLRVELPDGQILELPAGSRFELPGDYGVELPGQGRVELPGHDIKSLNVHPVELEAISPESSPKKWGDDSVSETSIQKSL